MIALINIELLKIFRKWRTYIGFIAIAIFVPLIEIALYYTGSDIVGNQTRRLEQDFILLGNLFNGWFLTHLIMNSMWVHIPFLICLVAGDVMSGEASAGTYRLLFTRPISRTQIIISKFSATLLYTFSLVMFLALLSILLGLFLLGSGDLLVFGGGTLLILPQEELLFRFTLSFLLAIVAMCVVSSLGFLFSVLVENAIGPIIGTVTIIMFFFILGKLPYDFFMSLKPYLFTNYLDIWSLMFDDPIEWNEILKHLSILLGYMFAFFTIAFLVFRKKDILS